MFLLNYFQKFPIICHIYQWSFQAIRCIFCIFNKWFQNPLKVFTWKILKQLLICSTLRGQIWVTMDDIHYHQHSNHFILHKNLLWKYFLYSTCFFKMGGIPGIWQSRKILNSSHPMDTLRKPLHFYDSFWKWPEDWHKRPSWLIKERRPYQRELERLRHCW